ncbi:hypothetical protein G3I59_09365 [Amycolatopsis rubida]|uniref:SdpA family antimicrobial peptide system protein n=1 Tax=Amycolatopsis rubida TaxID=112413 RepID=A0ABX0BLU1_9PSEU|nr:MULTISPECIES: hypothetical protein [Amycolatopsis]MYW90810.1 hypothetical protein [Amycolatopsis rubida]NEC55793.1 hypothetical protein [Amycolatopsis rubida]
MAAATTLLLTLVFTSLSGAVSGSSTGWLSERLHSYSLLWPQGWSFFTGLSRDDVFVGYKVIDDTTKPNAIGFVEQSRAKFTDRLGGLDRSGDTQQYELTQLASLVPEQYWQGCHAQTPSSCQPAFDAGRYVRMKNFSKNRTWCGKIAVSAASPARVTLSTLRGIPRVIDRIALVDLQCGG